MRNVAVGKQGGDRAKHLGVMNEAGRVALARPQQGRADAAGDGRVGIHQREILLKLSRGEYGEIPAEALQALYECDVEQFALLMMNMGREVSRRLRSAGTLE